MSHEIRILREDDALHDALIRQGWTVVATSWGARLHLDDDADLAPYRRLVERAQEAGYWVGALGSGEAGQAAALDRAVAGDYPWTPATGHQDLDPEVLARRMEDEGWLVFGARCPAGHDGAAQDAAGGGQLVAVTILEPLEQRWEVERTCVASAHRRRGLASAIKAASVLASFERGAGRWGTGGAAVNAGSLAANRALGFELEPLWHSLQAPPPQA